MTDQRQEIEERLETEFGNWGEGSFMRHGGGFNSNDLRIVFGYIIKETGQNILLLKSQKYDELLYVGNDLNELITNIKLFRNRQGVKT